MKKYKESDGRQSFSFFVPNLKYINAKKKGFFASVKILLFIWISDIITLGIYLGGLFNADEKGYSLALRRIVESGI